MAAEELPGVCEFCGTATLRGAICQPCASRILSDAEQRLYDDWDHVGVLEAYREATGDLDPERLRRASLVDL